MKGIKQTVLIIVICLISSFQPAKADACDMTLCMFGMLTGSGGGDSCAKPISEFFAIKVVTGFFDTFNPVATAAERKLFLKKCDSGVDSQIDQIIEKFGGQE